MIVSEYVNEAWRAILRHNQAEAFDPLWQLNPAGWFEPPNYRRHGWSGVVRQTLALPEGGEVGIFIKRQENHVYRSWKNLFRPSATFEREFQNLQSCRSLGVPTLEPIYFGQCTVDGKLRATLITRELTGYLPFDAECYRPIAKLDRPRRRRFFHEVAAALRQMHRRNIQYNCLYLKHIFVKEDTDGAVHVRLIDLEKAKWRPFRWLIAIRDLYSLNRRAEGWSRTDRLRLFLAYRQEARLSPASKWLLRAVVRRMRRKGRL